MDNWDPFNVAAGYPIHLHGLEIEKKQNNFVTTFLQLNEIK